jgi:DNA topoisomerase-1
VALLSGRYGPYVKHGKLNATVPQDYDPETLTLEQALEILAAKQAKDGTGKKPRARPVKAQTGKAAKATAGDTPAKVKGRAGKPAPVPAPAARTTRRSPTRSKAAGRRKRA